MKLSPLLAAALALAIGHRAHAIELANDGWTPGAQAGIQSGFVVGEIAAASLSGGCAAPTLQAVRLYFGGATTQRAISLRIYDDSAGQTIPGAPIFSDVFQLTGSDTDLSEINLSANALVLPSRFRVGVQFTQAGVPSVARDADGTINASRNFVFTDIGGGPTWLQSQALGITGDWIIRAEVSCSPAIFANGFE